jgi:hypothetical protein
VIRIKHWRAVRSVASRLATGFSRWACAPLAEFFLAGFSQLPLAPRQIFVIAIFFGLIPSSRTQAADKLPILTHIGAKASEGRLVAADERWLLTFENSANQRVPAAEIVRWGAPRESVTAAGVLLADGGFLPGPVTAATATTVALKSDTLGGVKLPRGLAAAIVFADSRQKSPRDSGNAGAADRLDFVNGDRLTGRFVALADKKIQWESRLRAIDVLVDNVARAVFAARERPATKKDRVQMSIGLDDGTLLIVDSLVTKGKNADLTLADGTRLTTELSRIVFLQPHRGGVTWLSDLAPQGYRHIPFLSIHWPLARDENVLGQPLKTAGQVYFKGLGMHSDSRVTYELDRPYRRLAATLALDDAAAEAEAGSVIYRVFTDDGSGRWSEKFASPIVRGGEKPVELAVDLAGAKRISLLVESADRGDQRDYANWLDARLEP